MEYKGEGIIRIFLYDFMLLIVDNGLSKIGGLHAEKYTRYGKPENGNI